MGATMKRWTYDDQCFASTHVTSLTYAEIAARMGRTERAVRHWCERSHNTPLNMHLMTTTEVAEEWGVSVQYVARLARQGKLPARRVPGGRRWLFDPERVSSRQKH